MRMSQPLTTALVLMLGIGYTCGTREYRSPGNNGHTEVSYGKHVTIWKRQPVGSWKIVLDGGNPSPAPAPTP